MTRHRNLVSAWMTQFLISTTSDEVLFDVAEKMADSAVRHVLVMDEGRVTGIVSNRDLVRATFRNPERRLDLHGTKVESVMTPNPICVEPSVTIQRAADLMVEHAINALPIVEEGEPRGILTSDDLLRALSTRYDDTEFAPAGTRFTSPNL